MPKLLKKCPFCGGEPSMWYRTGRNNSGVQQFGFIQCNLCLARSRTKRLERGWYGKDDSNAFEDPAFAMLVAAWNNRVEEDE